MKNDVRKNLILEAIKNATPETLAEMRVHYLEDIGKGISLETLADYYIENGNKAFLPDELVDNSKVFYNMAYPEFYEVYADHDDMTFIMHDEPNKFECIDFYFGEPDAEITTELIHRHTEECENRKADNGKTANEIVDLVELLFEAKNIRGMLDEADLEQIQNSVEDILEQYYEKEA